MLRFLRSAQSLPELFGDGRAIRFDTLSECLPDTHLTTAAQECAVFVEQSHCTCVVAGSSTLSQLAQEQVGVIAQEFWVLLHNPPRAPPGLGLDEL